MTDEYMIGAGIGFGIAMLLWLYDRYLYRKILQAVGEGGGREKINGEWYIITKAPKE
jgi:hypothetical protein